MSKVAADFSHPISSSQPISQNPSPSYSGSNGTCPSQSSSLNFDDKDSSTGLSFDFSNKGSNFFGQPKHSRMKATLKKGRGKISISENIENLNGGNEASISVNSTRDDLFNGIFGKKGGGGGGDCDEIGKFGKEGSVLGSNGCTFGSNFKNENVGFVQETNKSGLTSSFSNGSGNSMFGANKNSSSLNFNHGGVVFGAEKSSLMSKLNHKNDSFVFGADKISSTANLSNGRVGSVSTADENSSVLKGKGTANGNESTLKSSLENGSFVFGSSESYLSEKSNTGHRKSCGTVGQSGAHESNRFDNVGFLFCAKKGELASDSGLEHKCSNNDCSVQSGVNESEKFSDMGFVSGEFSERDGQSSSVFGTEWNFGGRKDHSGFAVGAKQNDLRSQPGKSKLRRGKGKLNFVSEDKKGTDTGNEFQKARVNGVFEFGNSSKDKPRSIDSNDDSDNASKLDAQKPENGSASVKWSSDAMSSNFKFVIGSSSSSAVYKVPLSKLCDDMKGLNIDNSKGTNGADKVKFVGSNSWFSADNIFSFGSNSQTSAPASGKENQTLNMTENISNQPLLNQDQPVSYDNLNKTSRASTFSSGASSHVQQNGFGGFGFDASPTTEVENKGNFGFTTTPVGADASSREFKSWNLNESFSFTLNLLSGLSKKSENCANSRCMSERRLKKTRGKLRQRIQAKHLNEQDQISKEGSAPKTFKSADCYSPMDFSPYQDTTESAPGFACASTATEKEEENFTAGIQRSDNSEGDKRPGEQDCVNSKVHQESNFRHSDQNGLSATRRQYRKKYKLKVGDGLNGKSSAQKSDVLLSLPQHSSNYLNPSCIGKPQVQTGVASNSGCKEQDFVEGVMNGVCDQWRMRGNQAYKIRDLSKAEEYYTNGINSVGDNNVSGFHIEPLLLCYSNRAATRMSLGRLREALDDCKSAAALDPSFLKAKLRAANCHLVMGEIQEAIECYNNCLESGNDVCLDRRIMIEAGDGLHKAQKVSEYMSQSAYLLEQRTSDAASCALNKIVEALSISCYSENLLKMKGEALFLLRRYDEVIELCEQTLHIAEKNFSAIQLANESDCEFKISVSLWRCCLMSKSHFHLGRLEVALDLIEKQENLRSLTNWSSSVNQESLIPLSATIRELLHRKKEGNEAFQSGKHMEAIEHYTAAISSCVDSSRPFAAICFCNRAAAHQALGLIADAIADCSLAIALDRDYRKAVSRRATLHEMIRDYKQAIADLQKLVSLLENQSQANAQKSGKQKGSNGSDTRELKRVQRRLSLIEDKANQGTPMDFYLILGIKASDTESEIKKAYRKAALKHHPDKAGQYLARTDSGDDGRSWKDIVEKVHEDADRLFKMIGEAYAVLSDLDKRSKYDYEEKIRNFCSDNKRNNDSGRSSDSYNSPFDGGHWPGRRSTYSGSQFERSRSRRYWQESYRSHDNSRY